MSAMRSYLRQISFFVVMAVALATTWSAPAVSAVVGTGDVLTEQRAEVDRQSLMNMLERKDVQQTLSTMGVEKSEVESRIQSLTPSELADFNDQLADAPVGQDVVGVVVLFLLVFIITDMLCATNIFSFINCIN
ncbi:PA2779 family protein [Marinobacter sp. CHS3-4]|uniref:PA2779 family protein n=1 Tax=Marinobacter sp. CHS3-4 TaxID=3045174 RepID=UPI0024B53BEB|nr:PA2779 family protein [Marinobacter sp. CHS3-4]MDI9243957.1 PA2779 family protein [Marinobacter sp. CHS3-4]